MRKWLLFVVVFLLNTEVSAAKTSNCALTTNLLWLSPTDVVFELRPPGGSLKLLGHGTHGDIIFELDRQSVDVNVHNEKMVILIGKKTIVSDKYSNDVSVIIEERKNADGTLNVTLQSDIRLFGAPAGTTTLVGTLNCEKRLYD